ncbi:uncharacterized protein LOC141690626 [Apium graveolens]|uniref:uncharacterized protein LOC141690626 n=1 Tax=Apium graveolens TaxID=4045 RepID=UPI003D7B1B41
MALVLIPIPFAMWAVDIMRILPTSMKQEKYYIIAIDYMIKWVEAKPLSAITEEAAKKYFLEQIILRFEILKVCVSETSRNSWGNKFRKFLHHFGVQQKFISVAHPQGNEAVKEANKIIFQGIKERLSEAKERCADKLPWVLWAYQMALKSSTGEIPFRLAYGTYALISVEVCLESYRTKVFKVKANDFGMRANIDLLE